MFEYVKQWYQRRFSDPDAVTLVLLLVMLFLVIMLFGDLLAPILVAVALAYLLEWAIQRVENLGVPRLSAVALVFTSFLAINIILLVFLVPVIWQQTVALVAELPQMLAQMRVLLERLPELFPEFISEENISAFIDSLTTRTLAFGELLLSQSLSRIIGIMQLMIYFIVVPLLIFFMLKDKHELLHHIHRMLPTNRRLITQVSGEMNQQIMNYIRGKALEVAVVGIFTYVCFALFDLRYAALLAVLVGLSVLIPYIGAVVVTIPVVMVALFQFGWSSTMAWVFICYLIIQILDGNVLVPLLFSEAVSLNPVYIIAAVLVFGGLWGFWGVFFAIPLASLVKAVLVALSSQSAPAEETVTKR